MNLIVTRFTDRETSVKVEGDLHSSDTPLAYYLYCKATKRVEVPKQWLEDCTWATSAEVWFKFHTVNQADYVEKEMLISLGAKKELISVGSSSSKVRVIRDRKHVHVHGKVFRTVTQSGKPKLIFHREGDQSGVSSVDEHTFGFISWSAHPNVPQVTLKFGNEAEAKTWETSLKLILESSCGPPPPQKSQSPKVLRFDNVVEITGLIEARITSNVKGQWVVRADNLEYGVTIWNDDLTQPHGLVEGVFHGVTSLVLSCVTEDTANRIATLFGISKPEEPVKEEKEECPECWGTGYWRGYGVFCSKGCRA